MSYNYQAERPKLFTDEGVKLILHVLTNVTTLCAQSGVCTVDKAMRGITGDSWMTLAAFDYLQELDKIVRVPQRTAVAGRDEICRMPRS